MITCLRTERSFEAPKCCTEASPTADISSTHYPSYEGQRLPRGGDAQHPINRPNVVSGENREIKPDRDGPKLGRPPAGQAGQVDERILQAAELFFLREGYARTTLEKIAATARIGNTTLYKRYRNKEALFAAVLHRSVEGAVNRLQDVPSGGTASQRLREAGIAMGRSALSRDVIAIMRISAAEAETFPNIARMGYRLGFDASVDYAARAIAGSEEPADLAAAWPAASRFVEVALHPLELQGMFGVDLEVLRTRIVPSVDDAIAILITTGLLDAA
jgi:AcrR family transcriptional regulator